MSCHGLEFEVSNHKTNRYRAVSFRNNQTTKSDLKVTRLGFKGVRIKAAIMIPSSLNF